MKGLPVARAALILTLTPVFGVAGGFLALGKTTTPAQWAGAALIVGAVRAVRRS